MKEAVDFGVRLRRPERNQMSWAPRCADDLVGSEHPVRSVEAVVKALNVSAFCKPIKARAGVSGRDRTDPQLLVGLWLYGCVRGIGSARELARRCEESAPFLWLCGGVTVNHRLLSDFRTAHGSALDDLFSQVIASLVDQDIVKVSRISQDGVRVRVSAGASSFRREERLRDLLHQSREHVAQLRQQVDGGVASGLSARQKGARRKAAEERLKRLEQAVAQLPELQQKQARAEKRAGEGSQGEKVRKRQPRVSTTCPEARRMKMPNGGFNPAVNVQLATDTSSRAIVGVDLTFEGSDSVGLSEPMRQQVQQRTGKKVRQHLIDGGYMRKEDIENAAEVELFVPPKGARLPENRGKELEPKKGDSPAILAWKKRMSSEEGKEIYKQRAATSETVNADLRTSRGLSQITVRGSDKIRCVALWCALAYNIFHFAQKLLG
jgi:transposase